MNTKIPFPSDGTACGLDLDKIERVNQDTLTGYDVSSLILQSVAVYIVGVLTGYLWAGF